MSKSFGAGSASFDGQVELRRAKSPQVYRLQGSPLAFTGFFSTTAAPNRNPSLRPKGRTERRALWLPAASMHMTNLPCTSKTNVTSVHSRLHACAPHAVGLCGLLHVPGMATCAGVPPFERAVARTCTWAVLRLTGVTPLPPFRAHAVPEAKGARCRKDQPHPAPRIEDDRDAPSTGTGRGG